MQSSSKILKQAREIFQKSGIEFKQGTRASMARIAALAICMKARQQDGFVHNIADTMLAHLRKEKCISERDAAFARKLSRGVAATWGTLDEYIYANLRNPRDIKPKVRDALRISAYEILFLQKESHIVVNEGVELVRAVAPKAAGLANVVLRKMVASVGAFMHDANTSPEVLLARHFAFPQWLMRAVVDELGHEQAHAFLQQAQGDAPLYAAANLALSTDEELLALLERVEGSPEVSEVAKGCIRIAQSSALSDKRIQNMLAAEKMLISDESAQYIAQFLLKDVHSFDKEHLSLLEVGSGRGTKTLLLQNEALRAGIEGIPAYALDIFPFKRDILQKRLDASQISWIHPLVADATAPIPQFEHTTFSHVFIDAPCSGVGTLRRHPEIRWRLDRKTITENAALGAKLLHNCASYCHVGGTIVYSTCTIFHEENEDVVAAFLETDMGAQFVLEEVFKTPISVDGADIHFAARLRKTK